MDNTFWRPVTAAGQQISAAIAADPGAALLAFDFDGTLAPIVQRAADARMSETAAKALAMIGPRVGNLAIITGRPVKTVLDIGRLAERPGLERLTVYGQYGVERWDASTGRLESPPVPSSIGDAVGDLERLLDRQRADGADVTGVALEDKGRAVGIHYRQSAAPEETASWLVPAVCEIGRRHGLEPEPGRMVVELRSSKLTKGDALATLIAESQPGLVLFAGDDLGDLPAFDECRASRTSGIVSANVVAWSAEADEAVASRADILCQGTSGLAAWLEHLADLMS